MTNWLTEQETSPLMNGEEQEIRTVAAEIKSITISMNRKLKITMKYDDSTFPSNSFNSCIGNQS